VLNSLNKAIYILDIISQSQFLTIVYHIIVRQLDNLDNHEYQTNVRRCVPYINVMKQLSTAIVSMCTWIFIYGSC